MAGGVISWMKYRLCGGLAVGDGRMKGWEDEGRMRGRGRGFQYIPCYRHSVDVVGGAGGSRFLWRK